MSLSIFLARLIGLTLVLVAGSMLVNRKSIELLFKAYARPEVVFITGMVETVLGLALILNHNVWMLGYHGVITFIGWMLLVRGVGRTYFPTHVTAMLEKYKKMESTFVPLLVFVLVVGAYLTWSGFMR